MGRRRSVMRLVTGWPLWRLPFALVLLVVGATAGAAAVLGAGLVARTDLSDAALAGVLCVAAGVQTEIGRRAEQVRRRLHGPGLYGNLLSAWFLVAAVLLPPTLAAMTAGIVHAHLQIRSIGPRGTPYRQVYSTAVAVLATAAASVLVNVVAGATGSVTGFPALATAMATLAFVNTALVAAALRLSDRTARWSDLVGGLDVNLMELATLCLGALVAVGMELSPAAVVLAFLPQMALHRAVLVRRLELAASTDAKTGLLNAGGWHSRAERALLRRRAPAAGLLVLDLDHFKSVNDTFGHLSGDVVLRAVAETMKAEVRDGDLVGRFGGEEFVVLLCAAGSSDDRGVTAVAERIRRRVAALSVEVATPDGPLTIAGLSVSIGAALCGGAGQHGRAAEPGQETDLQALLQAADGALYAAKRAGRNRVLLSGPGAGSGPAVRSAVTRSVGP